LNLNKTQYLRFDKKNTPSRDISISYNNTLISNTKFLGLVITDSLSWKDHTTQLIPKLNKACYILRCIRPFMSLDTLKSVYHYYFHSLLNYGIIFEGKSSYSLHVFFTSKKAVRIMGLRPRDSYRTPFKLLRILIFVWSILLCYHNIQVVVAV
jgi:hypothetical protein